MGHHKHREPAEGEKPVSYLVFFTPHEWKKVKAKAALEGKTLKVFIHDVVVADAMVMGFTARPSVEIVRESDGRRG